MKIIKKALVLITTLIILLASNSYSFALNAQDAGVAGTGTNSSSNNSSSTSSGLDLFGMAKSFITRGQLEQKISSNQAESDLAFVANIVFSIGILTLLITGMIMGVKYMISGADEKANMKQKLIWWVIATVLIFGSVGIYNIVANIFINSSVI